MKRHDKQKKNAMLQIVGAWIGYLKVPYDIQEHEALILCDTLSNHFKNVNPSYLTRQSMVLFKKMLHDRSRGIVTQDMKKVWKKENVTLTI